MQGTAKCRRCRATIHFIRTRQGKKMPCDLKQLTIVVGLDHKGPWTSVVTVTGDVVRGVIPEGPTAGEEIVGYPPHWATCSAPSAFRKRDVKPFKAKVPEPQMDLFGGKK